MKPTKWNNEIEVTKQAQKAEGKQILKQREASDWTTRTKKHGKKHLQFVNSSFTFLHFPFFIYFMSPSLSRWYRVAKHHQLQWTTYKNNLPSGNNKLINLRVH